MKRDEVLASENEDSGIEMFGFVPDENAKEISISQLEQSIRVEGKHGRLLQTRPIQSWTALQYIMNLLTEANIEYKVEHIYVQKRSSFPMINDEDKKLGYDREECPINKWLFDKVIASILIPNMGSDLECARIGFNFNDSGIEIAFGMHVHVCSNFCILGGDILRTYREGAKEPLSWEAIEILLKDWINTLDQKWEAELVLMNKMKQNIIVDNDNSILDRVIGGLYRAAINQAYGNKKPAPFDTAGMSQFVQAIINSPNEGIGDVWELYNYGTSIIKPGVVDIADIQTTSNMFAEYLFDIFNIERDTDVVETVLPENE